MAKKSSINIERHIMALHNTEIEAEDEDTGTISLSDYLYYNDVLYHGTETEKMVQSFKMLDLTNGNPGEVTQSLFIEFMEKYMLCRADLLQTKFKITDQMQLVFLDNF
jgi:hypothetical protein